MTIHEFLSQTWKHWENTSRIQGIVQARDHIILVTDTQIFRITDNPDTRAVFLVELIGYH